MSEKGQSIPAKVRPVHDEIAGMIERFCQERLNDEYRDLCLRMLGVLARKRPTPIVSGKPNAWACGIVRAVGWVNFLDDASRKPHVRMAEIDAYFGVSMATGQGKSKRIRDLLRIRSFDSEWTLPSKLKDNPMAWLVTVNGIPVDARMLPREIQEEAAARGIIPYVPGEEEGEQEEG